MYYYFYLILSDNLLLNLNCIFYLALHYLMLMLKSLELPQRADELFIAADGDAAGSKAAEALGTRAARQGWVVKILTAPEGRDWNDVLMERTNAGI